MVFYEGSVHIPFIMRLPCTGGIRKGTVVSAPVSNLALFGTIIDYLGLPTGTTAPRTSKSLRPLIEGTDTTPKLIFSVWMSEPGSYMVFDGRFKLVFGRKCQLGDPRIATSPTHTEGEYVRSQRTLDALYDLRHDRGEVINLLNSPYVQLPLSALHPGVTDDNTVPYEKARNLQTALVGWLRELNSSHAEAVAGRHMDISHINQAPVRMLGGRGDGDGDARIPVMPTRVAWRVGAANALPMPAGTFLDVDGDRLRFSGTLDRGALPDWLSVRTSTGNVFGKPPSKGRYLLRVTASDHIAGWAFVEFVITAR